MATLSNNDIARAIYLNLKGVSASEYQNRLKSTVDFLYRKKLLSHKEAILNSLENLINSEENRVVAKVTARDAIRPEVKKNIISSLVKRYNAREVVLEENIDQRLLGGFKIKVKDEIIDLSLSSKLKNLEAFLTR